MNHVVEKENEKSKEHKRTVETENSEDGEGEEMEDVAEGSGLEEATYSTNSPPHSIRTPRPSPASLQSENSCEEASGDSYEARKRAFIREKWMTVTGKKPRNFPIVQKRHAEQEAMKKITLFGDRRPGQIEEQRTQKWMQLIALKSRQTFVNNIGKVRREVLMSNIHGTIKCLRYNHTGQKIAISLHFGGVQIREANKGELLVEIKTFETYDKFPINTLRFHPQEKGKLYVAGSLGFVQVFNSNTGENLGYSTGLQMVNNMDFSPDGRYLVTVGRAGRAVILDAHTLQVISIKERPPITASTTSSIEKDYSKMRAYGLRYYPSDPNLFVSGGWDKNLKFWDVRAPAAIHTLPGVDIHGDGIDIYKNTLAVGSWVVRDSLKTFDLAEKKLLYTIPLFTKNTTYEGEFLYTVSFFKHFDEDVRGTYLAVGGTGFCETLVVNTESRKVVAQFPSRRAVIAMDTYKENFAYGGKETLLRFGELFPPKKFRV